MSTRLSVNINKVALLRNSRGANYPDLLKMALDCEAYGAEGITVHPRPDQRHVRYEDVPQLKKIVTTEFNIEGNPTPDFLELVLENPPDQCTLVPDNPDALTSDQGWNTIENASFLKEVISRLHEKNIRVSLFIDPDEKMIEGAKSVGADRIELYTGPYSLKCHQNKDEAIRPYVLASRLATSIGLGINAGHDLNLFNLAFFKKQIPELLEVSIGHALFADAIYYGLHNTIQLYLRRLI